MARDAGFTLDPWQEDVIQSQDPLLLINASRQSGKSLTVALLALHQALLGRFVLITAPSLRQSHETTRVVFKAYRALGRPVSPVHITMTDLELENGGRLVCLPGKGETIRGHSAVHLLIAEEATLVSDETFAAVSPMLATSRGRLCALFTPHGRRGWVWGLWSSGQGQQIEVPAVACPRIPPEFLEQERRRLGDYFYEQEFCNRWVEPQESAFRTSDIEAARTDALAFDSELMAWP